MSVDFISEEKIKLARQLMAERGIQTRSGTADLVARPKPGPAPLSHAQTRLWYHEQLHPNSALYNTPIVLELKGDVNTTALSHAFDKVIERHEILRSVFREINGEIFQIPLPFKPSPIPIDDLTHHPMDTRRAAAQAMAELAVRAPFDLSKGPLFYVRLIKCDDNVWWLLILNHHIVFDGWSRSVLMQEISSWYGAELGMNASPRPLSVQYADYAIWQNSPEHKARQQEHLEWWKRELQGAPHLLALSSDRPRPPVQSFRGNTHTFLIPREIVDRVNQLAVALGVTQFVVLTSALQLQMHKLSGQADLIVSTGIATRQNFQIENLIGCFINVLLLRSQLGKDEDISSFIRKTNETTINAFSHQDAPFQTLVSALAPERDLSYNPLAQVMIVHHNEGLAEADLPGVEVQRLMPEKEIAQYDLLLHLRPIGESLVGMMEYNVDLFDDRTVARMCAQFNHILDEMTKYPSKMVERISVLPPDQIAEILAFNGAPKEFPRNRTIHSLFEERVRFAPDAIAVEASCGAQLTYGGLNIAANQMAHFLRVKGVRRGDIVGISLNRTPEMVVALMAVAKSGAAYVPIDPSYPLDRIQFVAADSNAKVIVTHSALKASFDSVAGSTTIICVDEEKSAIDTSPTWTPTELASATDLLYLIYTSGSTGTPKGVMLDHRGRVNNFSDFNLRFSVRPGDRLLAVSSLSFDMCAYDVFGTLMAGATIVLPAGGTTPNPEEWAELLVSKKVTIWHSAPALLATLLDRYQLGLAPKAPELRLALLGGDWIPLSMPEALRNYSATPITIVSLGGATEVSMDSTIYVVDEVMPHWRSIPYGVAMSNQSAFVLDEQMKLAPIGVPGELFLGGIGVGWGYLRRPALTASRFLPNPYSSLPGERMYRTGDIARWTNEGNLELLGRADFQVKLNGLRIELGEIDAALSAQRSVKAGVASLYKPVDGKPRLIAYVVPADSDFDWNSVREALYAALPSYMVPRQCVQLERLPLSPNGKVQRKALPPPEDEGETISRQVLPQNATENMLHTTWAGALGHSNFGIDHDFFEIGGSSLQAALIINRLPRRLSLVEFMRNSTVRTQARLLMNSNRPADSRIFRFPKKARTETILLCVAYAGGSPIIFRGLAQNMPPSIATAAVCMPSTNESEASEQKLEDIATDCIAELSDEDLGSIAIYGHCAGTALAMEIAHQIESRGHNLKGLFLAAAMPPGVSSPFTMPRETEEEIVDFVAALGGTEESSNPEDWKLMVREFQRDSKLVRAYIKRRVCDRPTPIAAPLMIIMGTADPLTEGHEAHSEKWRDVGHTFTVRTIPGGHYFIGSTPAPVAELISGQILPTCHSLG